MIVLLGVRKINAVIIYDIKVGKTFIDYNITIAPYSAVHNIIIIKFLEIELVLDSG